MAASSGIKGHRGQPLPLGAVYNSGLSPDAGGRAGRGGAVFDQLFSVAVNSRARPLLDGETIFSSSGFSPDFAYIYDTATGYSI